MIVSVDGVQVFEINTTRQKVIQNDVDRNVFDEDMKRRLQFIINQKYDRCYARLIQYWMPILQGRYETLPSDPDQLSELIFSQDDYKDRADRDLD